MILHYSLFKIFYCYKTVLIILLCILKKMISTFTENVFHGKLELNNKNRKLRMIDDLNLHIMYHGV